MTRLKFAPAFVAFVVGAGIQLPLRAQQTPTVEPVIKAQSSLVLVDAAVTGKKGRPVLNLKQNVFHVYLDGKEQTITSFSAPAGKVMNPHGQHYLVLFFDATTMSWADQKRARAAAARFVAKENQPNLYMAAENFTGTTWLVQNFTTNRKLMEKAVSDFKLSVVTASSGGHLVERFLLSLTNVCRTLGQIPGRKALVLLSGGHPLPPLRRANLRAAIEAANRANVTIYPVDTLTLGDYGYRSRSAAASPHGMGGLGNRPGPSRANSPFLRNGTLGSGFASSRSGMEQILRALAKGTGGFTSLNSGDMFRGLSKIAGDENDRYTLGFVPPSTGHIGRYHRIEVKVSGKGLKVRARNGYYEGKGRDRLAGKPAGNALFKAAAGAKPGVIPMSMSAPFFYLGSKKVRVNISLEFPGRALRFDKSNGEYSYRFNVLGVAYRPDGSVAKRFSDAASQTVDKEQERKLSKHPFDYRSSFELAPGRYRLVVVANAGGSAFGKTTASLDITPYDERSLGLSGIAFTDQMKPVSPLVASLQGQLIGEEGALIAGGYRIQPSPTRAFPRSRRAAVYFQVYEPALLGAHPPRVGILVQITSLKSHKTVFKSGTIVINSQAEAGSSTIPVALTLPMAKLSPGAYRLSVIARDSDGGASPLRKASFSVE